ncbi:MAG: hypothetical protein ACRCUM_02845 [Mycoplasmoidaceae bacterium]
MDIYLIIVCGNYETKMLVGSIDDNNNLRVMYIDNFLSNEMIVDSQLKNPELFEKEIWSKIKKISNYIGSTPNKIILNLPTKNVDTISSTSPEYKITKSLTLNKWNKISSNLTLSALQLKENYLLGKKTYSWELDGINYQDIPFDIEGSNLVFKTQYYITKKVYIEPFIKIFDKLKIKIDDIVVDSMIVPEAFENNLRNKKAFINIGHDKSNFFYYKNLSLTKKEVINFGLKNLTHQIQTKTNVNEQDAIKILKIYKNVSIYNKKSVPFKISISEKIGQYNSFKYGDINVLIMDWLINLTNEINKFYNDLAKKGEEIDEIYILSATNILENWLHYIQTKLHQKIDVLYLNMSNVQFSNKNIKIIVFQEPKYITLIYSLLYVHKQNMLKNNNKNILI